mmetsp:Transcript_71292/g.183779  ORF Transcript_71292/g.183779 Transcript_71292/m.183779 type:complete len:137 (+) Transcript_71292:509-919(+)
MELAPVKNRRATPPMKPSLRAVHQHRPLRRPKMLHERKSSSKATVSMKLAPVRSLKMTTVMEPSLRTAHRFLPRRCPNMSHNSKGTSGMAVTMNLVQWRTLKKTTTMEPLLHLTPHAARQRQPLKCPKMLCNSKSI